MPDIKCRDRVRSESLGDRDHDAVDKSQAQRLVLQMQRSSTLEIGRIAQLEVVAAISEVSQERILGLIAHMSSEQIVDLRQDRPWQDPRSGILFEELPDRVVEVVICVDESDDGAGISDDPAKVNGATVAEAEISAMLADTAEAKAFASKNG